MATALSRTLFMVSAGGGKEEGVGSFVLSLSFLCDFLCYFLGALYNLGIC